MAERKFIIDNGFLTDDDSEITGNLSVSGTIDAGAFTVDGVPLSSGGSGSGIMVKVDVSDANAVSTSVPSVGFNLGTTNLPSGVQYGQTLTVAGKGDTAFQITGSYNGGDRIYWRGGNNNGSTWSDWEQLATTDYVTNAIGNSQGVGTMEYIKVEAPETAQVFDRSNGVEAVMMDNVYQGDTYDSFDTTNGWYVVPTELDGAICDATFVAAGTSSASSASNRMFLGVEFSYNDGANWARLCGSTMFDNWGNGTINGKVKVSAGWMIRPIIQFPDEDTRTVGTRGALTMNLLLLK